MSETVADMTKEELGSLVESIVEQKLVEFFGDPDEGMTVKENLRKRLVQQLNAVAAGERGVRLDDVVAKSS